MSAGTIAPEIIIKTASAETKETLIDQYRRLNERCDLVISKIKNRKNNITSK